MKAKPVLVIQPNEPSRDIVPREGVIVIQLPGCAGVVG